MDQFNMGEPDDDVADITEAFSEVLGYIKAYRSGAPAGPELGWAIRNFNEVCERHASFQDRDPATRQEDDGDG